MSAAGCHGNCVLHPTPRHFLETPEGFRRSPRLTAPGPALLHVRVFTGCYKVGDLMSALQMTPKMFEEKYHKKFPDKSSTLVFSCLTGIRSGKALGVATLLGYDRVQHYVGGFEDWTKHELPEKKP
ncbi:thiosulfate sulfurtransferase/rhodanese-like domain-containing protein 3 isoform X4 [Pseudophryne corroboree]